MDVKLVRSLLGSEGFISWGGHPREITGRCSGRAYRPTDGEVLFIEAAVYRGLGKTTLTDQIGDVMKESLTAALSLFRSRDSQFQYDANRLNELDLHIHVPAGPCPKMAPAQALPCTSRLCHFY